MADGVDIVSTVPMAHALWTVAGNNLKEDMTWQAGDRELQRLIVRLKEPSLELADSLTEIQMAAQASNICAIVNQFLKDQGFDIQLEDMGSFNMLYVAAVMKLKGNLVSPGVTGYYLPVIGRPAFRLPTEGLKHYEVWGRRVVEVPTSSNFKLLVTERMPNRGFNKLEAWMAIRGEMFQTEGNGLILPMAAIDETKVDVNQLVGMKTLNAWRIMQALMAVKFWLTPEFVSLEAAFAFSMGKGATPWEEPKSPQKGDYVADHDLEFALVAEDESVTLLPYAAGQVPVEELARMNIH